MIMGMSISGEVALIIGWLIIDEGNFSLVEREAADNLIL